MIWGVNMTKVSVIMPVYNCVDVLKRAVEAVLNQTLGDIELILVDDCSDDGSGEIIDEYSKKHENVKAIHLSQNSKSPSKPRNMGINLASADYIMFQDAADEMNTNACQYLYDVIVAEDADIAGGFYRKNNDSGAFEIDYGMWEDIFYQESDINREIFESDELFTYKINSIKENPRILADHRLNSKIYRKSLFIDNNIEFCEDLQGGEDNLVLFNALIKANGIVFINRVIYDYHVINSNSLSKNISFKTVSDRLKAYSLMYELAVSNDIIEIFVTCLLGRKLNYWTSIHLTKSKLSRKEVISLFKSYHILFSECRNYGVEFSQFFNELCEHIKNGEFEQAGDMIVPHHNPKISIIIPVYNVSGHIQRAFDSILNQTIGFESLEVIFVDDASTDGSDQIIKKYADNYDNVKGVFLENNSGCAGKPRNVGISNALSDYVIFLDPDDLFMDNACEILFDEIEGENCDIVSGVHTLDGVNPFPGLWLQTLFGEESTAENKNEVNQMVDENFSLRIESIDERDSIITNHGLSSKIFKKDFLIDNDITFPEKIVAQGSVFLFNAFLNASGIKFINKLIYLYCRDRTDGENASASNIFSKNRLIERLDVYFKMYYLSLEKNRTKIFVKHLLLNKLNYFTKFHLLKCDLPINDMLDILEYATPLYKLYFDYNPDFAGKFSHLFRDIACKNYEDVLRRIFNCEIPNQKNIKVATIFDSFSHNSFKYEFDLISLTPDSWKEQLESGKPDLFFCESAYHGISKKSSPHGVWVGKLSQKSLCDNLKGILTYCNQNNIPTIFWNKEDPISFTDKFSFTNTALNFDYIFTSCEESVSEYNLRGHENVCPLMFASQPKLFNPIKRDRLNDTVVFAGTWYSKFPQRCKTMSEIFDRILNKNLNLKIYDRFSNSSIEGMKYPEKYQHYVNEGVEYNQIPEVYKESEFGLNFNTVTDSNTMFARRVFELMTSNTVVLSNYSKGVYRLFGDNVVYLDRDEFDWSRNFDKIKEENLYNVLENHNYSKRFRQILDTINFKYVPDLKHIVLFYRLDDLRDLIQIQNHFYSIDYPYKHLKLICDENNLFLSNTMLEDDLESVELKDNYYFCFADLNLNPDFIKKALLHFQYIGENVGIMENDEDKYGFGRNNNSDNVVFNSLVFKDVLWGNEMDVYYI